MSRPPPFASPRGQPSPPPQQPEFEGFVVLSPSAVARVPRAHQATAASDARRAQAAEHRRRASNEPASPLGEDLQAIRSNALAASGFKDWHERFEELLASSSNGSAAFGSSSSGSSLPLDLSLAPIPSSSSSSPSLAALELREREAREQEERRRNHQQFIHTFPLPEDAQAFGDPHRLAKTEERRRLVAERRRKQEEKDRAAEAEARARRRGRRSAPGSTVPSASAVELEQKQDSPPPYAAATASPAPTSAAPRPVRASRIPRAASMAALPSASSLQADSGIDFIHARQLALLEMEDESTLMNAPPVAPSSQPRRRSSNAAAASLAPTVRLSLPSLSVSSSNPSGAPPAASPAVRGSNVASPSAPFATSSSSSSSAASWQLPDFSYDALLALDDGVKRPALDPTQLAELQAQATTVGKAPSAASTARGASAASSSSSSSSKASVTAAVEECSICLCEFTSGDKAVRLPCTHSFHVGCIKQWLSEHTDCPNCRTNIKYTMQQRFGAGRRPVGR